MKSLEHLIIESVKSAWGRIKNLFFGRPDDDAGNNSDNNDPIVIFDANPDIQVYDPEGNLVQTTEDTQSIASSYGTTIVQNSDGSTTLSRATGDGRVVSLHVDPQSENPLPVETGESTPRPQSPDSSTGSGESTPRPQSPVESTSGESTPRAGSPVITSFSLPRNTDVNNYDFWSYDHTDYDEKINFIDQYSYILGKVRNYCKLVSKLQDVGLEIDNLNSISKSDKIIIDNYVNIIKDEVNNFVMNNCPLISSKDSLNRFSDLFEIATNNNIEEFHDAAFERTISKILNHRS